MGRTETLVAPTVEEFLSGRADDRIEWANGVAREKPAGPSKHRELHLLLGGPLAQFLRRTKLGRAFSEWHHRFGPHEDTRIYLPDIAVALRSKVPTYSDICSDIMIEIVSPSQNVGWFMDKIEFYLANGAKNVRLVEPDEKWIAVYAAGQSPLRFAVGQKLTSPLLPGFELDIDELFADLS